MSIQTLEDLHGKRVGYIDQVAGIENLLSAHPAIQALPFSSLEEVIRALLNGQVDAVIGGSSTEYWRQQNLQFGITLSALIPESLADLVIGVRSDWPELTTIINKGLADISDGEMQTLKNRWFSTMATLDQKQAAIELTPDEKEWIAENHTIRVTFSEVPPYFSFKGGKVHGIAVDFLNTISENTGIKFQFDKKPQRFAEELKGLREHTGPDLVSAIMPTPEREKDILFTQLYIHSPRFIFTRNDATFVSSIENLFGKKVAVIKDYVTHRYLVDNYPDIDLMVLATNEEALGAVSSGAAFAYIGDLLCTPTAINEFGLKNLKAACSSGLPDHNQAMGIRNDWPELRDIMSKALAAIPADEKAAIMNKWTTVRIEHGTRPGEVRKWILIIGGISILVVLAFIAWNRTLKRMVMEKTATLAESEQRFRATFEQAAVGIAHVSPEGNFLRVNQWLCDILGYSTEELVTKTFQEIIAPEDRDKELEQMEQLLAGKIDMHSRDKRYIRKDGLPIWINSTVSLVRNEKGQPLWFMKVVKDMSKSKRIRAYLDMAYQATQILVEAGDSHELLQRVIAVIKASAGADAVGIRLQDGDDFPYFEQDGFSVEFLAKENSLHGHDQDRDICRDGNSTPILECTCGLVILGKTDPANPLFTREGSAWTNNALPLLDVPTQDDPRTPPRNECIHQGYASVALIPIRAGVQIVGLLQLNARRKGLFILPEIEILESIGDRIGTMISRKQTEEEIARGQLKLAHMSRVSTMAELSTSLAHELNQPLSAILSNAQAGLRFMKGGEPDLNELAEILADIVADDKRAGGIIQKLRAFLRNTPPELEMLDANIVVRDVLNILNSEVLIHGITITTDLAAQIPCVRADRVQLQQVLINLIVNAEQAMTGQEADDRTLHIKTCFADGNVVVSLQDTGPGVPEEALERIFDPFYSTRKAGMGMGLAISRSIITANGGQMWAENIFNEGARFCVMLLGDNLS
jgi:PAS domain S-box-containing protein